MLRNTVSRPARSTETVSALGLTTHTNLPSREIVTGLDIVGPGNFGAPLAVATPGVATANVTARAAHRRRR